MGDLLMSGAVDRTGNEVSNPVPKRMIEHVKKTLKRITRGVFNFWMNFRYYCPR